MNIGAIANSGIIQNGLTLSNFDHRDIAVPVDPIAYGCAARRHWLKDPAVNARWCDVELIRVEEADLAQAAEIRQYYQATLVMRKLRFGELSAFGNELYNLVSSSHDPSKSITKHLGIIYRLPYFYAEDLARTELIERFRNNQPELKSTGIQEIRQLRPVMRILRSRRNQEMIEYWWQDQQQQPVLWNIRTSSGFESLINSLFERDSLKIDSYFYCKRESYDQSFQFWIMINDRTQFPSTN